MEERSIIIINASEGMDRETAWIVAVERAVVASLQRAIERMFPTDELGPREDGDVGEVLPVVVVKGESWEVRFDVLGNHTRSERKRAADAIAVAYMARPWLCMAACSMDEQARGVMVDSSQRPVARKYYESTYRETVRYLEAVGNVSNPAAVGLLADQLAALGEHGAGWFATDEDLAVDALGLWFDPAAVGLCHYPKFFASSIWFDVIQLEAEAAAPRPPIVKGNQTGDSYLKVPKTMGAVAWGVSGMANIDVDGSKYTSAPGLMRYLPRAHAVLPYGRRPHQQTLGAAMYDSEDNVSLVSRAVSDTQALLGTDAGKLTLLFMATGIRFNKLSLRELVEEITPDRRIQKRDYRRVAEALRDIRGLGLVLPDNTDVRLFDIRAPHDPTTTTPDQIIAWAYTQTFRDAMNSFDDSGSQVLRALKGEFLINYSAIMRFDARQGVLMRHYLAAATVFNDSMGFGARTGYDPAAAPRFTREQWAAQTNSLSQAAVDLVKEGKATKVRSMSKSRDLKQSDNALDELESMGLIKIEGPANARQIIAPDEWQEAYRVFRTGGARPDFDK